MTEAFIVDGVRTPIGRYAGGLAAVRGLLLSLLEDAKR